LNRELVYLPILFKFMRLFLVVALSFILVSCGNSSEEEIAATLIPQKVNTSLFGNKDFVFPTLTENAKNEVMPWGVFEDFEAQAKSINGNTIEIIKEKSLQMVSQLDSLTKKIPDTLFTKAIYTRVIVAQTRANLLNQEVNKAHIDSVRLQDYLNEMNVSVKNLLTQINEKLQKDNIDLQRIDNEKQELEKQKKFLDSVYKAELNDVNRKKQ